MGIDPLDRLAPAMRRGSARKANTSSCDWVTWLMTGALCRLDPDRAAPTMRALRQPAHHVAPAGASHSERRTYVLIDHRTYRVKPGTVQAHLDLYEKYGLAAQTRHLGKPVAYMFAESGDLNTIVHMWAYEDAADRAAKRAEDDGRSGVASLSEKEHARRAIWKTR